jgi:hypothetical protein
VYEKRLLEKDYAGRGCNTDFFQHRRADLVSAMDAETYEAVIQAYLTIDSLRAGPSNQDHGRMRLELAIKQIKSVEEILTKRHSFWRFGKRPSTTPSEAREETPP